MVRCFGAGPGWRATVDRGEAVLARPRLLPRTALARAPTQRRSMRVGRLGRLVRVDLPVDVALVLEQQERASQAEGIERTLGEG